MSKKKPKSKSKVIIPKVKGATAPVAAPKTNLALVSSLPTISDLSSGALIAHDAVRAAAKGEASLTEALAVARHMKVIEEYFTHAKKSAEEEKECAKDRAWWEWKAGLEIKRLPKAVGGPEYHSTAPSGEGDPSTDPGAGPERIPTLAELGISHDLSSDLQKLADIPEEVFEELVDKSDEKPTRAGLLRAAAELVGDDGAEASKGSKGSSKSGKRKKPDEQMRLRAQLKHLVALSNIDPKSLGDAIYSDPTTWKRANAAIIKLAQTGQHIQSLRAEPVPDTDGKWEQAAESTKPEQAPIEHQGATEDKYGDAEVEYAHH